MMFVRERPRSRKTEGLQARADELECLNASLRAELRSHERSEGHLRRINADLEMLNRSIAHDLKAPLRAIQAHAAMLDEEHRCELADDAVVHVEHIRHDVVRLNNLLDDLLTLSRFGAGFAGKTSLDLEKVFNEALSHLGQMVEETGATVTQQFKARRMRGYRAALLQAFINLLTNAMKFQAAGQIPKIDVGSDVRADEVVIWVRDNGVGIAHQHLEHIFKPFERLSPGQFDGTGIGLPIVQKAVEAHEGRIEVNSEPGHGSEFLIFLPGAILED